MKRFSAVIIVMILVTGVISCERSTSPTQVILGKPVMNPQSFQADLNGDAVLPEPVDTEGGGRIGFFFTHNGRILHYRISTWDVEDVTSVTIHRMLTDSIHEELLLLAAEDISERIEDTSEAFTGQILADDLPERDLKSLHDQMVEGKAYLVVATADYPAGEIAGMVYPVR